MRFFYALGALELHAHQGGSVVDNQDHFLLTSGLSAMRAVGDVTKDGRDRNTFTNCEKQTLTCHDKELAEQELRLE
jgi:hypothetical protein